MKLKSVKKSNEIRRQILEKEMQLAELNIQMEIERAKAQQAILSKYDHDILRRSTPTDQKYQPNEAYPTVYNPTVLDEPNRCINPSGTTSTGRDTTNAKIISDTRPEISCDVLRRMQLPKTTMDTFAGDMMKFGSFIRQFENNITTRTDNEEEKYITWNS